MIDNDIRKQIWYDATRKMIGLHSGEMPEESYEAIRESMPQLKLPPISQLIQIEK
jgi:hypothetical protein